VNRREAGRLVGTAWSDSDYRTAWETRIMRRRVPLYRAGIAALRALNVVTGGRDRPSLQVTQWERVAPGGRTFVMDKLETMTARTDHPVTSRAELRERTSFAARLARAVSADEWPQIIAEYDRRRRGEQPQYRYVGHRPLNAMSHALMDEAWVRGELPTEDFRAWNELKFEDEGAFYSRFFTHGNARGFAGGETNSGFRQRRVKEDVSWRANASLAGERQVLRRSRTLRAKELVKFLRTELKEAIRPPAPSSTPVTDVQEDLYTKPVVAAIADFTKPEPLRSPTARGETTPDRTIEIAITVQKALPPTINRQAEAATEPATPGQPPPPTHPLHEAQPPAHPPAVPPTFRPAHSPRDAPSR
jgi:hypothetical protein